MCEPTAYIIKDSAAEVFLEDVDALEVSNKEIWLANIFSETKKITATIKPFSVEDHKILLESFAY